MAINVTLNSLPGGSSVLVSSNRSANVRFSNNNVDENAKVPAPVTIPIRFSTNATPIVIRNDALIQANDLRNLNDVVMQDQIDGNTLVYNAVEEKFILESGDHLNIHNIDGGSF
jgi:hypothetical protein